MFKVLLIQLPIPPLGPELVRGNVPLAAGYLKHYSENIAGVAAAVEVLPPRIADTTGDAGLVEEVVARRPDLLGFSCYVWNAERSIFLARQIKERLPQTAIVLGGPEATRDNTWLLESDALDFAVLGEGEQTFAELLGYLSAHPEGGTNPTEVPDLPGLWNRHRKSFAGPRPQLPHLNDIGRVYLHGVIDPRWHNSLFLETVRGCVFQCAFCFYPKSFANLSFMSSELVWDNLELAHRTSVSEVFLLDPTLNQRQDFPAFLELLERGNPQRRFAYSAELRAEGIRPEHAARMKAANFSEVELGLQSLGRRAQELMHRRVNRAAFEKGVRALMEAGIRVRADLIVGLPGDTAETVRQGIRYLRDSGLYHEPQVFRFSVLPGTEFRRRATELGLEFQAHPPYHVLRTPTLSAEEILDLMREAEAAFNTEFDPWPVPDEAIQPTTLREGGSFWEIDLDRPPPQPCGPVQIAHTLWFKAQHFAGRGGDISRWVDSVLASQPHISLWIVLDITEAQTFPRRDDLLLLLECCYRRPLGYWDWHLALHPRPGKLGAKRMIVYSARPLGHRHAHLVRAMQPFADVVEAPPSPPCPDRAEA